MRSASQSWRRSAQAKALNGHAAHLVAGKTLDSKTHEANPLQSGGRRLQRMQASTRPVAATTARSVGSAWPVANRGCVPVPPRTARRAPDAASIEFVVVSSRAASSEPATPLLQARPKAPATAPLNDHEDGGVDIVLGREREARTCQATASFLAVGFVGLPQVWRTRAPPCPHPLGLSVNPMDGCSARVYEL